MFHNCRLIPIVIWSVCGTRDRFDVTVPVFFTLLPGGYRDSSSARLTVGPPLSIGSRGSTPFEGPGSTLLVPNGNCTWNEFENAPAVRIAEISSKCVLS